MYRLTYLRLQPLSNCTLTLHSHPAICCLLLKRNLTSWHLRARIRIRGGTAARAAEAARAAVIMFRTVIGLKSEIEDDYAEDDNNEINSINERVLRRQRCPTDHKRRRNAGSEEDDMLEDELLHSLAGGIKQRNSNWSSSNKKKKRNSNYDETCIYCMNNVNNVVNNVPDIICTCSVICSDSLVRGRLI